MMITLIFIGFGVGAIFGFIMGIALRLGANRDE